MVMNRRKAVVLVGHGGVPRDYPRDRLSRLRALESERERSGGEMSPEEFRLDSEIRNWPRTPESDPYREGLRALAARLEPKLKGTRLELAYNEFCAPSIDEVVGRLAGEGYGEIVFLSSMFTPGGSHSERDIPEMLERAGRKHPEVSLHYAWPYDLDLLAGFMVDHVDHARTAVR